MAALRFWCKLGWISFGGTAAHIALCRIPGWVQPLPRRFCRVFFFVFAGAPLVERTQDRRRPRTDHRCRGRRNFGSNAISWESGDFPIGEFQVSTNSMRSL